MLNLTNGSGPPSPRIALCWSGADGWLPRVRNDELAMRGGYVGGAAQTCS
jgi:hypothetical protein